MIDFIIKNNIGDIKENYSLKKISTIGIGGIIKYLIYPYSIDKLKKLIKFIKENNYKYLIIGNCSNLLFNDIYFDGIFISLKRINNYYIIDNKTLILEAGCMNYMIKEITKKGYGNLEFMATIPGTVGGFIYNNAGAYHKEIKDVLISVDYLDNEGNIKNIETKDLMFSYRSSIFKMKQIGIIIRGYFKINNQGDRSKIDYFYDLKKRTQPINEKNLGSVFKNNLISSWKIIDKIGYRGKKINDIMVSLKHANFIINIGNATYKDTITLIKDIQNKSANIGYNLELEWEIIENFR